MLCSIWQPRFYELLLVKEYTTCETDNKWLDTKLNTVIEVSCKPYGAEDTLNVSKMKSENYLNPLSFLKEIRTGKCSPPSEMEFTEVACRNKTI